MTVDSDPSLVPVSVVTGDPSAVLPEGPVVTLPDPLLPPPSLSPLITPSVASLNDDGVILTPPPSPFADDEPSPTLKPSPTCLLSLLFITPDLSF
ncbi:hypothetical protein F2Q69_00025482 [Brassica cretica]|uniref:Uncharacterized protein n=1 Tax=Brassica cretica TaxID=69181 RepID=A0A8S9Q8R5_BRACR|nr:hypothetical protein F2Q69_00025482 [Brassica cretica]